jgi:cysteine desulfurase
MDGSEIYLDHNSTTPPLPEVLEAMATAAPRLWGNPSSVHAAGRRARDVLERTRERLAQTLGFHPRDVVFTSGGTEANNLALAGAHTLLLSRLEHPSVVRVAEQIAARGGNVSWLPVDGSGQVTAESVERALFETAEAAGAVVAVMAANHETGVLQPLPEIARVVRTFAARLHTDAVQLLGKADLSALDHADTVSVTAHKLGGPKGIGALLFRGLAPSPVLVGGVQERGLRPGTQDAVLATGFEVALLHSSRSATELSAVAGLRDQLEAGLREVAERNGLGPRLPHVSNLSFGSFPGPEMVAALDLLGVRVSSGSACSAGTSEPSPVIEAMLDRDRAKRAVRFSLGRDTRSNQVEQVIRAVFRVLGV